MIGAGLNLLADDSVYLVQPLESEGIARLPKPKEHLLLLLENFQQHLRFVDKNSVISGLNRLRMRVDQGPGGAEISFPQSHDVEDRRFDLHRLPDTSGLRRQVRLLISSLKNAEQEKGSESEGYADE